jgi:phosphatidylglycerol:prolipoprotein diacylglycerol transferase
VIPYFPPLAIPLPGTDQRLDLWLLLTVGGIAAGTEFARSRAIRKNLSVKVTVDCTLFMVAMGFVVAHFVHILAYNYHLFAEDWRRILPWYGGYSSMGGFLGAAIAIPLFLKGIKRVPFWPYLDNLCVGFMLGYALGRSGCFTAHDHMGAQSTFFLAVDFPERLGGPRHDLGLYEALLIGGLFLTFVLMDRARVQLEPWFFDGLYSAITLLVYGPSRILFDSLRARDLEDFGRRSDVRYYGLTPAQYGAIGLVCLGLWIIWSRRGKGQQDVSQEALRDFKPGQAPAEVQARAESGPIYARPYDEPSAPAPT